MKNKAIRNSLVIIAFVCALFLVLGCHKKDKETTGDPNNMEVRMTDGPGKFERCVLDIRELWVYLESEGWVQLPMTRVGAYNLLAFSNGVDTLIARCKIKPGKIKHIKFVLGTNNHISIDGVVINLDRADTDEDRLVAEVDEMVEANGKLILYLDIDIGRSLICDGVKWKFHPFIKCWQWKNVGSISGKVMPDSAAVKAYAVPTFNPLDTSYTFLKADGSFMIWGLKPSAYTVNFVNKNGLVVKSLYPVSVSAMHETVLGVQVIP